MWKTAIPLWAGLVRYWAIGERIWAEPIVKEKSPFISPSSHEMLKRVSLLQRKVSIL